LQLGELLLGLRRARNSNLLCEFAKNTSSKLQITSADYSI
jgi:hypothetical protein